MKTHYLRLHVADSFVRRFLGLMGKKDFPNADGVLFTRTGSVHTFFMRFAIDIVYLDKEGRVLSVAEEVGPWRISAGLAGSDHAIELSSGAARRLAIEPGDIIVMPVICGSFGGISSVHRGSSLVEFVIVAPLISLMGLGVIQYGLLFFAKNNINHAAFMAARAGANEHADMAKVRDAYINALTPLYARGRSAKALLEAHAQAEADLVGMVRFELINPTKESFEDWNDPDAQLRLGTGTKKVIPNSGLAFKPVSVKPNSGQSLQDANIIKLRITHGFEPKVPLISGIYLKMLGWLDPKADAFHTALVDSGRIPVVTHVTLHMNSDAIEQDALMTNPGAGNGGKPHNPGEPPVSQDPIPVCVTVGCTVMAKPEPPKCNPATDADGCRPFGCRQGDPKCDPACGVTMCCSGGSALQSNR